MGPLFCGFCLVLSVVFPPEGIVENKIGGFVFLSLIISGGSLFGFSFSLLLKIEHGRVDGEEGNRFLDPLFLYHLSLFPFLLAALLLLFWGEIAEFVYLLFWVLIPSLFFTLFRLISQQREEGETIERYQRRMLFFEVGIHSYGPLGLLSQLLVFSLLNIDTFILVAFFVMTSLFSLTATVLGCFVSLSNTSIPREKKEILLTYFFSLLLLFIAVVLLSLVFSWDSVLVFVSLYPMSPIFLFILFRAIQEKYLCNSFDHHSLYLSFLLFGSFFPPTGTILAIFALSLLTLPEFEEKKTNHNIEWAIFGAVMLFETFLISVLQQTWFRWWSEEGSIAYRKEEEKMRASRGGERGEEERREEEEEEKNRVPLEILFLIFLPSICTAFWSLFFFLLSFFARIGSLSGLSSQSFFGGMYLFWYSTFCCGSLGSFTSFPLELFIEEEGVFTLHVLGILCGSIGVLFSLLSLLFGIGTTSLVVVWIVNVFLFCILALGFSVRRYLVRLEREKKEEERLKERLREIQLTKRATR